MSSASPRPDSHIVAGRYAIQAKLGSGSIGTVYLSTDLATKSAVALKLIRTDRIDDNAVRKLKEEFRTLASLKHPSIAQALDFGYTADRLPFYTREHIVGDPLPGGPPPESSPSAPGEYLRPILDLLGALEYLHGHGILHLDIHAGNVIVSTETRGGVLIDFGLVAQRAGTRLISSRGSSFLADLANEPPSVATDLRATGRLLLYRLTGRYDGDHRLPREIRGWEPHVLLALERVIDKAMATDPAQRFLSAREMREAIAQAVGAPAARRELGEPPEQTIGRDEEIGRIEAAVGRALSGHAAVLWIHGPSGVGKTRLLTDVRWRAQLRGLDVVGLEFLRHGGSPTAERQIRAALRGRSELVRWLDDGSSILPGSPGERARRHARA
ncbi:MAG TPA: protein kinase, partial [Planctomycetota bacterium]|nr:protein kinase [Planctomycetota bacterium]